ncbi:MAG: helix-turn-helix transcriptional regulator [Woeseiaceae bacterium]|jgi:predicted XRE-type DNA-binding protein
MQRKVTKGNVFNDLGFSDEEAVALAMRVDLAVEIEKFIKRKKMTQTKAAAYFDVPQPKISKIMSGKVSGFSIEYLVKMAAKAGKTPRISFVRKQAA